MAPLYKWGRKMVVCARARARCVCARERFLGIREIESCIGGNQFVETLDPRNYYVRFK